MNAVTALASSAQQPVGTPPPGARERPGAGFEAVVSVMCSAAGQWGAAAGSHMPGAQR